LIEGDWQLHLDHLENLVAEASIRNINPGVYRDPDNKWMIAPLLRGGSFVEWFLKQRNLKTLKKKMIRTISRPCLVAFWSVKIPLLLHFDQDYCEIQREVNLLMKQDLKNNPEKDNIVQQAFDLMNLGLVYFQSENKFYQTLRLQGRLVLKPIEKSEHSFGVDGLKIPRAETRINKRTGQPIVEWKYDSFYKKFLQSEHTRYQFFEWSPEALNPKLRHQEAGGKLQRLLRFRQRWVLLYQFMGRKKERRILGGESKHPSRLGSHWYLWGSSAFQDSHRQLREVHY
jgi:hypothetical protein